jgi:hypothetical protein
MLHHATIHITRSKNNQFQSGSCDLLRSNLQFYPGSLRYGRHFKCNLFNQLGNIAQNCRTPQPPPAPPHFLVHLSVGITPPPPSPPPPPQVQPFNTNHKAMINKYGGAIWSSVLNYLTPPFIYKEIEPYMYMDPT